MKKLSEPRRLVLLIGLCTLLWSLESVVPLYNFKHSRNYYVLESRAGNKSGQRIFRGCARNRQSHSELPGLQDKR